VQAAEEFLQAVKAGNLRAVKALVAGEPGLLRARDPAGVSAVLLALYHGRGEVAAELLAHHPGLDIFEAAAAGRTERVAALLGADPKLKDRHSPDGFSPLGLAAFFGRREVLQLLLERGAAADVPSKNGMQVRPLHSAAANRDGAAALATAKLLLEHGAQPNVRQEGGWTPLHQAAASGNLELMKLLLEHGADPRAVSDDQKSPRALALERGQPEAARLLERLPGAAGEARSPPIV
jgi:ankyrin repeat protein